ncbi:polysaccharide pyruvyl transferase family protein [Pseudomonas sp. gcc21]|uniref:polysaccharide pyruvyl transferase family protein n=1 Tax=Pseudomonas sp. gcc21 TaxID=2726989 RepID=UPI00145213A3|nr:polysaccharide pyruvyl transferase family protein [Pseudomonas sp. gcc21]QJD58677.1 polysaccharide pyruvyl transferase family protein [Pseudomonas sp. gcc21]
MNISIVGSFMTPNFGDELLLEVMVRRVREFYGEGSRIFVPYCFDDIKKMENVKYGGGDEDLLESDLAIFGGGGYLGENPAYQETPKNSRWWFDRNDDLFIFKVLRINRYIGKGIPKRQSIRSFYRYHNIVEKCKRNHIPYVIFGAGCGPLDSYINRIFVRSISKAARQVFLRDCESVKAFNSVSKKNDANQTCDIVLSELIEHIPTKQKVETVAFHIGQISSEAQLRAISEIIDFVSQKNVNIKLICDSFSIHQVIPSKELSAEKALLLSEYKGDTQSFVDEIKSADLLITTKLHAAIVAYSVGTIPISIPSHGKTRRFFKQIGMVDYCAPEYSVDPSQVKRVIDMVIRNPNSSIVKMQGSRVALKTLVLTQISDCFRGV